MLSAVSIFNYDCFYLFSKNCAGYSVASPEFSADDNAIHKIFTVVAIYHNGHLTKS